MVTGSVQETFHKLRRTGHPPDLKTLETLLLESVTSFKMRLYIILDALDECNEGDRKILLRILQEVSIASHSHLYFFITTRPHITIDSYHLLFPARRKL